MPLASQDVTAIAPLETAERTARLLLRYVDRAALDELIAAFVEAIGLPAAVLSLCGELIAGDLARCPACSPETSILGSRRAASPPQPVAGWSRCDHGLSGMVAPITSRTGEHLAVVAVGALALSDDDLRSLHQALVARGASEHRVRALVATVARASAIRVEAAARLLSRTFATVVREAAIASENADLVAIQRQANRELTVLYSVAQAIGSGIELKAIMQQLVDAVGELLGCDVALVGLIEGGDLVTVASCGLLTFEARNGRLKVGEGLAGRVAATGTPLTCFDMQDDPRQYLTAINSREDLHAFAGVPLKLQGETVGVLAIYRRQPHTIPDRELRLLTHIADQAAVAMERSRLYEQERLTTGKLQSLHGQVDSQHQALERATALHNRLTQLVLEDAGLDAIVDSLARLLESTVAVEDQFHHLLALGPRDSFESRQGAPEAVWTPPRALQDATVLQLFETVRTLRRPVSFPALPDLGLPQPRIVAPVIVGGDLLGFLSISERERPLTETDLLVLGHATMVIALEMMKQRTHAEVERRLRGELLEELVAGRFHDASTVQRRAAYLGYNLGTPHALLYIATTDSGESAESASLTSPRGTRTMIVEALQQLLGTQVGGAMVMSRVDGVLVAFPARDGTTAAAKTVATSLTREAVHRGVSGLTIGLGRICHSLEDFPVSFAEARRSIDLARSLGMTNRVICFEDLGVFRLLIDLPRSSDAVRSAEQRLTPLVEYDARHDSNLLDTLDAYLTANGTLQRAASNLSIHVNTLTYRLQRIQELTGIDFRDSDARLEAHLALKIRQAISRSIS